jgi:hypothetical protein
MEVPVSEDMLNITEMNDGGLSTTGEGGENALSPIDILVGLVIRPGETFEKLREAGRGYWGVMFAITAAATLLLAIATVVAQNRVLQNIQMPEGATTIRQTSGVLQVVVALAAGAIGALAGYLFCASVVFVSKLILGGKTNGFKQIYRMAVWTTLPLAIRKVMQAIASFVSGRSSTAGMSGILSIGESVNMPTLSLLLSHFDIYLIWSMVLLGIGTAVTAKLDRKKTLIVVGVYLVLGLAVTLGLNAASGAIANLTGGAFRVPGMGGGMGVRRGPGG